MKFFFLFFVELGSKISSFFSSRKDETNNNSTNTTEEAVPEVRGKSFSFIINNDFRSLE